MSEKQARRAEIKQSLLSDLTKINNSLDEFRNFPKDWKKDASDIDDLVDLFIGSIKGKIDTLSRILEDIKP